MSESRFAHRLTEQIGNEFAASQQYIAIAAYYDADALPQLAGLFYRQSVEERNHAMIMVQYLLDADEPVVIPGVEPPQTAFSGLSEPVALALEQERRVSTSAPTSCAWRARAATSQASSSWGGSSRSSSKRSPRCRPCCASSSAPGTTRCVSRSSSRARATEGTEAPRSACRRPPAERSESGPGLRPFRFCPWCGAPLGPPSGGRQDCAGCGEPSYLNPKATASAIVLDGEGRVLLGRRGIEPFLGLWDTPGGFVEVG